MRRSISTSSMTRPFRQKSCPQRPRLTTPPISLLAAIMCIATWSCGGDDAVSPGTPDAASQPMNDASMLPSDGGDGTGADADMPESDAATLLDAGIIIDASVEPPGVILINEVVTFPLNDWSDSSNNPEEDGAPFDITPGTGTITSADQFIELINAGDTVADVRDWQVRILDSGEDITQLVDTGEGNSEIIVSQGSTLAALQPGHFVLVGNPNGTMATDVSVILEDDRGNRIDDVEIGGEDNGAPAPGENGYALGSFEEAIARPAGQPDTDNDQADFIKMFATPLAANVNPAPPADDITPPELVGDTTITNHPINQFVRVTFNEPLDGRSIPVSAVSMSFAGGDIVIERLGFADNDSTIIIETRSVLPFGRSINVVLGGGPDGIRDRAGNTLVSNAGITVQTEDEPADNPQIRLNEICVEAQQDWGNDDGGDGTPFSAAAGSGRVSSSDEWIELFADPGGNTLSIENFHIEVFNGPSTVRAPVSVTYMDQAKFDSGELRIFGLGTSIRVIQPGDYVVLGNPRDIILNDSYIVLRHVNGTILDAVEIGGNDEATDRGGDGVDDGAPEAGEDGNSSTIDDETIARVPNGADTGSDTDDWAKGRATLGASNGDGN